MFLGLGLSQVRLCVKPVAALARVGSWRTFFTQVTENKAFTQMFVELVSYFILAGVLAPVVLAITVCVVGITIAICSSKRREPKQLDELEVVAVNQGDGWIWLDDYPPSPTAGEPEKTAPPTNLAMKP